MSSTSHKRLVLPVMLLSWMLAAPGCGVKQSEYDAKVAEAKSQADKVSQLQKDFDVVKGDFEKARQEARQSRKKDAEAKIKTLEQENTGLKDRVKALELENAALKASAGSTASQYAKDVATAKGDLAKVEQARKAAEAKIKTLEQENAELKKKSKPLDFLRK